MQAMQTMANTTQITDGLILYLVVSKLDHNTQMKWEEEVAEKWDRAAQSQVLRMPTWEDLVKFLQRRCQLIDIVDVSKDPPKSLSGTARQASSSSSAAPKPHKTTKQLSFVATHQQQKCNLCDEAISHNAFNCTAFMILTSSSRVAVILRAITPSRKCQGDQMQAPRRTEPAYKLWFHCPNFIVLPNQQWPQVAVSPNELPEQRKQPTALVVTPNTDIITELKFVNNYNKVLRIFCYVQRFIDASRGKSKRHDNINVAEMNNALYTICRIIQGQTFPDERKQLEASNILSRKSSLAQLSPFLHDGLIRVGGRLVNSTLPFEENILSCFQKRIPSFQQPYSTFIDSTFMLEIRHYTALYEKDFGLLTHETPSGSSKAVHLELVPDLTSAAFIAALKHFIARRGRCRVIYSDNATNYVGANRELLQQFMSQQHNDEVQQACCAEGIEWKCIPPRSPHFGGLWESAVKQPKHYLRRAIGAHILTQDELRTFVARQKRLQIAYHQRP
ncbi:uncharacterized protein LOC118736133 [Rhagoletis pomonella]|uniref:uncharacterized protein LOC118736133 n=1 Tax=Rhagoletis pomonella TaxID=28610 RepID=UPI00177A8D97|nr:uncharacterized protein LOC118736133 [Rhagoletis pomonella]